MSSKTVSSARILTACYHNNRAVSGVGAYVTAGGGPSRARELVEFLYEMTKCWLWMDTEVRARSYEGNMC